MKTIVKMAAVAALALVSVQANAQNTYDYAPKAGTITTEVKFNPFANNFNTFSLSAGNLSTGLKGRYFLTDQNALRLNINFGLDNTTTKNSSTDDDRFLGNDNYTFSTTEAETVSNKMNFSLALGYERHFLNNGRLDIYAGAELGYEAYFYSGEKNETMNSEVKTAYSSSNYTIVNTTSSTKTEYSGMTPDNNYNNHNFFVGAFTGVDFYLYKGLYVGTEFGLRFSFGKTMKSGNYTKDFSEETVTQNWSGSTKTTTKRVTNWTESTEDGTKIGKIVDTDATNTTKETEIKSTSPVSENYVSNTKFAIYIEPALRLGWRF